MGEKTPDAIIWIFAHSAYRRPYSAYLLAHGGIQNCLRKAGLPWHSFSEEEIPAIIAVLRFNGFSVEVE